MADAADLKSAGEILVGSNPSPGTVTPEKEEPLRPHQSACRIEEGRHKNSGFPGK